MSLPAVDENWYCEDCDLNLISSQFQNILGSEFLSVLNMVNLFCFYYL